MKTVAVVILALLLISVVVSGQAVDPQTLIGEWQGQWSSLSGNGKYYLTIEKVQGDKVYLRIERPDMKDSSLPKDVRFVGTLTGNLISYEPPRVPETLLTVEGKKMTGTSQGRSTLKIELQKTK